MYNFENIKKFKIKNKTDTMAEKKNLVTVNFLRVIGGGI